MCHRPGYELDHFIPLALGGHPRKPENLWLQPWNGPWGAKTKDQLEVKLKSLVCSGRLLLADAREAVKVDWKAAYTRYVGNVLTPRHPVRPKTDAELSPMRHIVPVSPWKLALRK